MNQRRHIVVRLEDGTILICSPILSLTEEQAALLGDDLKTAVAPPKTEKDNGS